MERPVTFYLTKRMLVTVIVTLSLLSLLGTAACLLFIFGTFEIDVRLRAVCAATCLGLAGSAIYYLRRLYRAAFDKRLELSVVGEFVHERIATALYLFARPLIAVTLSATVTLGVILSYTAVTPDGVEPTIDLVYLTSTLGFVTGFLTGRVIEQVETSGRI
jgi:hypothetical protein